MDPKNLTKNYSNGEVTVVWQNGKCIHSAICFKGLSSVFDPGKRPWINITGASTAQIIEQVKKVLDKGPLLIYGTITVKDKDGNTSTKNKTTAFCRCGASANKPYCDGTHVKVNFVG